MFIEVLLVLILITLVVIGRTLTSIDDNIFNRNQRAKFEHSEKLDALEKLHKDLVAIQTKIISLRDYLLPRGK